MTDVSIQSGANWEHPYFYEFNRSFNPQTAINKGNVRDLALRWTCILDAASFGQEATGKPSGETRMRPRVQTIALVIDGDVFVADGGNRVYSVDAKSGTPRWSYQAPLDAVSGFKLIHTLNSYRGRRVHGLL